MSERESSLFRLVVQPLLIAVAAALLVRAGMLHVFSIPSRSMSPTYVAGDHLVVSPLADLLLRRPVSRGDVVVFRPPFDTSDFYIKRVIALPGDYVVIRDGRVIVNGRTLAEPYVRFHTPAEWGPEIVPGDCYFVLGDNRADSYDSRQWGFVPVANVVGQPLFAFHLEDDTGSEQVYADVQRR